MNKFLESFWIIILVIILSVGIAIAGDISAEDAKVLEKAGIPIYKGAQYVNGKLGGEMNGLRLATSAALEEVRAFYRSKFPSWALNDEYGSWILYNGEPGGGPAAYMDKQQVQVMENKKLNEWFGIDKNLTTEIVIVVP
jgi:hypothetical protein